MKATTTAQVGGIFYFEHRRQGKTIGSWETPNLVPTAGLNHTLDTTLGSGTPTTVGTWYIGVYSNTYTPQADDVYTHIGTRFTEITTAYDEATRETYVPDGASASGLVTNSTSRATFTFNSSVNVSGAIFVSSNIKGDNAASAAVLLAASAHSPARAMISGDELLVKYEFQGTSS